MSTNMALTKVNHQRVIINITVGYIELSRYLVSATRAVDTSTGLCPLVKRINICMDKENNGETFVYFSQMKDI